MSAITNSITEYSFLQITNITNYPVDFINDRIESALSNLDINDQDKISQVYQSFDKLLEDFEQNGKVADLLSFVDNFLINFDFENEIKTILEIE